MATNKKHTTSIKYQKALTLKDRISLTNIITTNRDSSGSLTITLNDISDMLEKDPTTLSKEVKNRRTKIDMSKPQFKYLAALCKTCAKKDNCEFKQTGKDTQTFDCDDYVKYVCKHLTHFPWVCNGCKKRGMCESPKSWYSADTSHETYVKVRSESRKGIYLEQDEFDKINEVLSEGLKKKQSFVHIVHSNDLSISVSTAYNYLHKGYLNANLTDTHRMVRLRPKNGCFTPHNSKILKKKKEGRNYDDFIKLLNDNPEMIYVQMDTVEGKKGGKVCLSLKIVQLQFQFYFLLENKTAKCVVDVLNRIQSLIGIENYKKIFSVILTDNGSEFTNIDGIMLDPITGEVRTELYFCHPMASSEKGSCERNHQYLRYILPKGKSFNTLTQDDFNKITSHVNSAKRKSIAYSTPIELFYAFYGKDILNKLGISLIDPNSVILSEDLLK